MKISQNWLKEWVSFSWDSNQLAAALTMAGLEVDSIEPVAGIFSDVVVAEVLTARPHPEADRLTLCEVNAGDGKTLQIVCGAKNVRAGLKVALAQIGAQLPSGLTIKEAKLRGQLSQGMLCSASELGLAETSEGILELASDAPLGENFRTYYDLDDHVLDVDLTPNRADCLSVVGIAREVSALTDQPLHDKTVSNIDPTITDQQPIKITASEACPAYCGRSIKNINSQAQTPLWMQERLRRSGMRSIHPIVDITNYVMLELGQPLHAFDADRLQGAIGARYAKDGEKLTILDGQILQLQKNHLVIADEKAILGLAGIMGGLDSGVTVNTTHIFLESAFFTPTVIAGVARSYGLFTESAQRFERGVDPHLQRKALERATELILMITGGEAGPVSEDIAEALLPKPLSIPFNPKRFESYMGFAVDMTTMLGMLKHLGMAIDETGPIWQITPPSYRFDIHQEVDLIEEIVRLYGYDKIPQTTFIAPMHSGVVAEEETLIARMTQFFAAQGYHECINFSFVDSSLQEKLFPQVDSMKLLNPISSEHASMRVSLWPGLMASMLYNVNRQQTTLRCFESGVIFGKQNEQVIERACVAGLVVGDVSPVHWLRDKRCFDFFDMKGDLERLFCLLKMEAVTFVVAEHSALHPGKSALIRYRDKDIGWFGVLHPEIAAEIEIDKEVILFELYLDPLLEDVVPIYHPVSKFPSIRRDLSLLVDKPIQAGAIEAIVRQVFHSAPDKANWLKGFDIFDVYTGDTISPDKKSLAISLLLQDDKRTLVDDEISEIIHVIITKLQQELAIIWREE